MHDLPSTSQPVVQKKSILKPGVNPPIPEATQKDELESTTHARSSTTPMSAREKRSILRELKARVDSFDEEQKANSRYYIEQQQAIVYDTPINKNIEKAIEMDINRVRRKSSMGVAAPSAKSLPNHVVNSYSPQKRANSVSGHDPTSSSGTR